MRLSLRDAGRGRLAVALSVAIALLLLVAVVMRPEPARASSQSCYSLTTTEHPYGHVFVSPAANCGSEYAAGTVVTLQVWHAACYRFVGWTGDASGSEYSTSIVMDSPKSVGISLEHVYGCPY
jgi:hypothetical protein